MNWLTNKIITVLPHHRHDNKSRIKCILTGVLLLLLLSPSQAQKTVSTITVLGRYKYVEYPEAYGVEFYFEDIPNKCDPVLGSMSLEDRIFRFSDSLQAAGLSSASLLSVPNTALLSNFRAKTFRYVDKSPLQVAKVIELCRLQSVQMKGNMFSIYAAHNLEAEDESAVNAFRDAKAKAAFLAKKSGKKLGSVLVIDDDTSTSLFGEDLSSYDENMLELIDLLGSYGSYNNEKAYTPFKRGEYGLLVTFELK